MARVFLCICISFIFSACTTAITSTKLADDATVPGGVLYALPATAIESSMAFLPSSCRVVDGQYRFQYEIIEPVIKNSYIGDTSQQFVFDYNALNSKMKITAANVALYSNGTLKSINADVDDRTAEVVNAVGGLALNLVKASVFVPSVAVSLTGETKCPAVVLRLIGDVTKTRVELATAKVADSALQEQLGALEKAKAALTAAKEKLEAAPNDVALKKEVKEKTASVTKLETATKGKNLTAPAVQTKLNKILAVVVARSRVLFAPQLGNRCGVTTAKGGLYLEQFIDDADVKELVEIKNEIANRKSEDFFTASVCVEPAIAINRKAQILTAESDENKNTRRPGIVYREPVMARVVLGKSEGAVIDYSTASWVSVPQYGPLATLDLSNGPFDKNSLKVTFAEDGGLNTLDFNAQSAAERGAVAAQNLSKTYLDIVTARENAKAAREKAASEKEKKELTDEIAQYENELKLLNAKAALTTAQNGKNPVQSQIDATDLETSLVKKQIELEKARAELEKLKAGTQ